MAYDRSERQVWRYVQRARAGKVPHEGKGRPDPMKAAWAPFAMPVIGDAGTGNLSLGAGCLAIQQAMTQSRDRVRYACQHGTCTAYLLHMHVHLMHAGVCRSMLGLPALPDPVRPPSRSTLWRCE